MALACLSPEISVADYLSSRHRGNPSPLLALTAHPKPYPFVPGVEIGMLCARQDLCQCLHLRSLTTEPLTTHRTACGGAPARQSDREVKEHCGHRLPAPNSTWGGRAKMERPPLRVRTHSARLWTHSPLPRRSWYRTQALPKAPPQSDLTLSRFLISPYLHYLSLYQGGVWNI